MQKLNSSRHRVAAVLVTGCAGLALTGAANAVDLRDWGRKYNIASERFVVLGSFNNEAVLDKETQLVWRRAPREADIWLAAFHHCIVSATGGRQGWRLPSISELASLSGKVTGDVGGYLPAGHPFQNIGTQDSYWSSTEYVASPTTAAYIKSLLTTGASIGNKSESQRYLCVRGVGVSSVN